MRGASESLTAGRQTNVTNNCAAKARTVLTHDYVFPESGQLRIAGEICLTAPAPNVFVVFSANISARYLDTLVPARSNDPESKSAIAEN